MVVQGLELQGWNEDKEEKRVQTFTVQFGIDETNLTSYKEDKIYDRVSIELLPYIPITTIYIILIVKFFH